jgi:phage tail-like protein
MSDVDLAQLADQFRAQRPAPPAPYSFPKIENKSYKDFGFAIRDAQPFAGMAPAPRSVAGYSEMSLMTSGGSPNVGWRPPPGDIRLTQMRLAQRRAAFSANVIVHLGWNIAIEMSLLFSASVTKPGSVAAPGKPRPFDHFPDYAFKVEIADLMVDKPIAHFQKFDGLDLEIEAIEYKTGDDPHAHKRPGVPKYGNIKLSKGVIANQKLWDWCMDVAKGTLKRRNITITVLDEARDKPLQTLDCIGCWPTKWTGLRLDGKSDGALIEEIEFAIDYATIKTDAKP